MGIQLPSLKRGQNSPNFRPIFIVAIETAGCIRMPLGMELGLSSGDFVFDGDPAYPAPEKGHTHPTQFLAHVYCGQTAGWMKTPRVTQIDIGPDHIVLDGGPGCPQKGHNSPPPSFRPMSIVATVAHLSFC